MAKCSCKPGIERDSCSKCEGTGQVKNFSGNHICPKCGKRGDGMRFRHEKHGCDDNRIDTDRNLMMNQKQFERWQDKNASEPMKIFDIAWDLMKSDSQGCDVCGETDGVFTYMDNNKRAHMVCSDACMDKNKGKGRGTTPVLGGGRMVKSDEKGDNAPTNPGLWSQAKSKARSKFKVYPSAYANGWAAKWYKSKGGGWKKKSKGGKKK